ncbi:hypothetical protein CEXT_114631 [Caerostris extrusa]|uniref:Uncharacterized protein n=1 Tax=Caerostris extrusa TaxID=172846 RepID=A0AAV4X3L8_CAEEX|nr:hypothetical protein CEXT_114631 [Caerostris extrusa]
MFSQRPNRILEAADAQFGQSCAYCPGFIESRVLECIGRAFSPQRPDFALEAADVLPASLVRLLLLAAEALASRQRALSYLENGLCVMKSFVNGMKCRGASASHWP